MDFQRRLFIPFLVLSVATLVHVRVSSASRAEPALSLRQRVESLFQNGMRNAQHCNDVFGQARALRTTLREIGDLRRAHPAQLPVDEKAIVRRERQLKRMIAKETLGEAL